MQFHAPLWSQSVVSVPAASASLGNLLERPIPQPTLDLLNQKAWEWIPAVCFQQALCSAVDLRTTGG